MKKVQRKNNAKKLGIKKKKKKDIKNGQRRNSEKSPKAVESNIGTRFRAGS